MKLGVLSDIHGNIAALEAVLADLDRRDITEVINLGDCLSGPLAARATADRLMALNWPTVRGNHDRMLYDRPREDMGTWEAWVIDDLSDTHLDWVRSFPASIQQGDLLACHATPDRDDENWLDYRGPQHRLIPRDLPHVVDRLGATTAPVIVCGHTHTPRVVRIPGGPMIVNVGSVGCPAYLDTRNDPNFVQQTGAPDARYVILEKTDAGWRANQIHVPYDATDMIELARAKGVIGWVKALSTGWTC